MLRAKQAFFLFCLSIVLAMFALALHPMRSLPFSEIPIVAEQELSTIADGRKSSSTQWTSLVVSDTSLPLDEESNSLYTPALTDDIFAKLPSSWDIVRTESSDGVCKVLFFNKASFVQYTLIETGLPVISIQLFPFFLKAQDISFDRIPAIANILSVSQNGRLLRQTENIEIKRRGGTSQWYPKASYTLFSADTQTTDNLFSLLGLPADRKFALNSFYEDDSKIRDVLSNQLWKQIEPNNALQFVYTEVLINNNYWGLYGLHQLPTEHTLPCQENDYIYKINGNLFFAPGEYPEKISPYYEFIVGDISTAPPVTDFFSPFSGSITSFPKMYHFENFADFSLLMEIIASRDAALKNLLITYHAEDNLYTLSAWDMDQSFGSTWNSQPPLYVENDASLVQSRYLYPAGNLFAPLSILYTSCPDFTEAITSRYRELRQTIFTDEALLDQANELYDLLTDSGARQRDAERWPASAISTDNSFIEAFIPARMAFLDEEFAPIN